MATATDIDALFSAARAAWPALRVPREQFSAWIEERAVSGIASLHADDLYLACACAHGVPGAIRLLEARYFGAVDVAVARFGPAAFAADVRQELLQRLFVGSTDGGRKIAAYGGRGGLQPWLVAVAVRIALNLTRARKNQPHVTLTDGALPDADDPELCHIKALYRAEFKRAFADALAALPAELQNFLRLYYLDGLDLADIAAAYQVSVPTVSRRLARARADALASTRKLLQDRLKVGLEDVDSIMRLIQSQLSMRSMSAPGGAFRTRD